MSRTLSRSPTDGCVRVCGHRPPLTLCPSLLLCFVLFVLNFTCLFIFGCAGSSLLRRLWCPGFSLPWLLLLRSTGPGALGLQPCSSLALGHRLSNWVHRLRRSTACGIFPHQGSNPCLLQWQVYSLALSYQGSPPCFVFGILFKK